jgi:hypothetical protein
MIAWTKAMSERAPHIVTRRSVMLGVARRFKEQYPDDTKSSHRSSRTYGDINAALSALDLNVCNRGAIDDIIGNDSWTQLECSVCEMDRDKLVSVPRQYSEPVTICAECATGALSVLKEQSSC